LIKIISLSLKWHNDFYNGLQLQVHIKLSEVSLSQVEISYAVVLQRMLILQAKANVLMSRKQILIERVMEDVRLLCDPDWNGVLP
jgi:hypothetical protein